MKKQTSSLINDLSLFAIISVLCYALYYSMKLFSSDNVNLFIIIISAVVFILFILLYNKTKTTKKMKINKLVVLALFLALSIIGAKITIMLPVIAGPGLAFSLGLIPIIFVGIIFGPCEGAIVGFLADIIGFVMSGGAYPFHPGFTLVSVINGFVPGFVIKYKGFLKHEKTSYILSLVLIPVIYISTILYILSNSEFKQKIEDLFKTSSSIAIIIIALSMIIQLIMFIIFNKKTRNKQYSFSLIYIAFMCAFVITRFILTPIILFQLYQIPIPISILLRVAKSTVEAPLSTLVVFTVLNALPKKLTSEYKN